MLKCVFSLMIAVLMSGAVLAQTATNNQSSSFDDYKKDEFYVGYSTQRDEPDETLNGFEAAYVRNVRKYVGLKASFTAGFGGSEEPLLSILPIPTPNPGTLKVRVQNYTINGGVQFKNNSLEGSRFKPFAHGLVGATFYRAKATINGAGVTTRVTGNETGLALTLGGGLDIRVKKNFQIRLAQIDYNPIIINGDSTSRFRFGAGLVF